MRGGAARAWAITLGLAAAVLWPLAWPRGQDSFPLSTYPMFSRPDLGRVVPLAHARLLGPAGRARPAPPELVGTPEVMVAKALVEAAIARGEAQALCARVAARAAADAVEADAVEIVTSTFDSARYFASREGREPLSRVVHARCAVPRSTP